MARTVAQVHREAEGSLLATQLLLAQGALALSAAAKAVLPSARKVLLEIRADRQVLKTAATYLGCPDSQPSQPAAESMADRRE